MWTKQEIKRKCVIPVLHWCLLKAIILLESTYPSLSDQQKAEIRALRQKNEVKYGE